MRKLTYRPDALNEPLGHHVQALPDDSFKRHFHTVHHEGQAWQSPQPDVILPLRMPRHVLRLPPHHLAFRWVLESTSSGAVVVEDAGPAVICDTQSLLVGVLHLLRCPKVALQEVLRRRKLGTLCVHGGWCYNLLNRILVGDEQSRGGHR